MNSSSALPSTTLDAARDEQFHTSLLVLHAGLPHTGAAMLQYALDRLRPQLRARGVAYVGHEQMDGLPHAAGWDRDHDADPGQATAFERDLAALVGRERAEARAASGAEQVVTLVSTEHLLGRGALGQDDAAELRPHATRAVGQIIAALGAVRARVVLYVRRQDRLMEYAYLCRVRDGDHHDFAGQFPYRFEPVLDYAALAGRLCGVPNVADVRVRPVELVEHHPDALVRDLLAQAGVTAADLPVPAGRAQSPVYSRRGLRIALAMNPHLDTDRERELVRGFLLEHFATRSDRESRFLPREERRRILVAYRPRNRMLFRRYLPELPAGAYAHDKAGRAAFRPEPAALAPAPPAGPAPEAPRAVHLADLLARFADRNRLAYRTRLRYLSRRCDAYIVSFPKCGRTWLRVMLGTALGEHYGVRVRNVRKFTDAGVHAPGLPRVLATHDDTPQAKPADRVQRDKRGYRGRRVVLLVRDPRDVVVSLYFHQTHRRRLGYAGDLAAFLRDPVGSLTSLLAFYDAWAAAPVPDLLLVRYEDMHADPAHELRRVLAFLGVGGVRAATVRRAVLAGSFDRLQRLERDGTAATRALRTDTVGDPESYKVRRGKVGGFADYLDPADVAYADAAVAASAGARAFGYPDRFAPGVAARR